MKKKVGGFGCFETRCSLKNFVGVGLSVVWETTEGVMSEEWTIEHVQGVLLLSELFSVVSDLLETCAR